MPLGGLGGVGAVARLKLGGNLLGGVGKASREASGASDGQGVARRDEAQRFQLHQVGKPHAEKLHAVGVLPQFSMGRCRQCLPTSATCEG